MTTTMTQSNDPVVKELMQRIEPLAASLSGRAARHSGDNWRQVHTLLKKMPTDQLRVGRIVAERNSSALTQLIDDIRTGKAVLAVRPARSFVPSTPTHPHLSPDYKPPEGAVAVAAPAPARPAISEAQLVSALRAFKRRLKVTQLDEDSKLSSRALTGGRKSTVKAIQPPNTYPKVVWDTLAERGKLRRVGTVLYEFLAD